jgi:hypothetical protein
MSSLDVRLIPTVPKITLEVVSSQEDDATTILVINTGDPRLSQGNLRSLVLVPAGTPNITIGQRNVFEVEDGYSSVSIETNFGRSKGLRTTYYLGLLLTLMGPKGTKKHRVDCGSFPD